MSGSDPSVPRGGASGGGMASGGGEDECPGQPFETVLASPDPNVVAGLTDDELLSIQSIDTPVRGVLAYTLAGEPVGAVVKDILRLRQCMAQGHVFEADVLDVTGGAVTIWVRPA